MPALTSDTSSGITGLLGAILGSVITQSVTVALAHRKSRAALSLLVARVSIRLERLADGCAVVAEDWGEYDLCGGGQHEPEASPRSGSPSFTLDGEAVDWSVLKPATLKTLLRLEVKAAEAAREASSAYEYGCDPPDHLEYFETRTQAFATVGLEACALADRLEREARGTLTQIKHLLLWQPDSWEIAERRRRLQQALDISTAHRQARLAKPRAMRVRGSDARVPITGSVMGTMADPANGTTIT